MTSLIFHCGWTCMPSIWFELSITTTDRAALIHMFVCTRKLQIECEHNASFYFWWREMQDFQCLIQWKTFVNSNSDDSKYRPVQTIYSSHRIYFWFVFPVSSEQHFKEVRGPLWSPKNESCVSPISSNLLFRRIAQVLKSGIYLTFTVAIVTKMATKIGFK